MTRKHTDLSRVPLSVAPSPATSGTTLGITDANAALLPDTYPYWIVAVPTGQSPTRANSEVIKVTAGSSSGGVTTLTIVRAQGIPATTAKTITTSFDIYEAHTAQKQTDVESIGTRVYHNANQTLSTGVGAALAFNSERFDTDTMHDNVTNNSRITIKTAGKYLFIAHVAFAANASGYREVDIVLNGSINVAIDTRLPISGGQTIVVVSGIYDCAVNDYATVNAVQTSGGNLDVLGNNTYSGEFSAVRIGN